MEDSIKYLHHALGTTGVEEDSDLPVDVEYLQGARQDYLRTQRQKGHEVYDVENSFQGPGTDDLMNDILEEYNSLDKSKGERIVAKVEDKDGKTTVTTDKDGNLKVSVEEGGPDANPSTSREPGEYIEAPGDNDGKFDAGVGVDILKKRLSQFRENYFGTWGKTGWTLGCATVAAWALSLSATAPILPFLTVAAAGYAVYGAGKFAYDFFVKGGDDAERAIADLPEVIVSALPFLGSKAKFEKFAVEGTRGRNILVTAKNNIQYHAGSFLDEVYKLKNGAQEIVEGKSVMRPYTFKEAVKNFFDNKKRKIDISADEQAKLKAQKEAVMGKPPAKTETADEVSESLNKHDSGSGTAGSNSFEEAAEDELANIAASTQTAGTSTP